jgi:asparagine synthase (glutamine-hydrolysing)
MQRWRLTRYLPDQLIRSTFSLLTELYPVGRRGWGILYRNSMAPLDSFMADVSLFHKPEREALLRSRWQQSLNGTASPFAIARMLASNTGDMHLLSQMQYIDQMLYLPDDILVKVDRASMAVSLETRAPLLDYRLAEFMATVPAELRYRRSTKKYLLKHALEGILPAEILHRPKMGFGVPLQNWFRGASAGFAREILLSQTTRERGFFDPHEVELLFDRHDAKSRDFSSKLWTLLFFELWCRHWLDERSAA